MKLGMALAALLLGGAALSLTLAPTDAERQQAIEQGQTLAAKRQGYPVGAYVIYSVSDALTLSPGEGSVEAVQLATPLERERWASYFLTIQGKDVTPQAVQNLAKLSPDHLEVIVYAHSQSGNESDQGFLKAFGSAQLTLNGQTLRPAQTDLSGASRNNYRDAGGQVTFRWTGTVTYDFDLSKLGDASAAQGQLQFTDAVGKGYDVPVNLGDYR